MNIELERQPECKATLKVEVPPDRVAREREKITALFTREAKIPGFRPGKAPAHVITRKFGKRIEDELRDRLIREAMSKAFEEEDLRTVGKTVVKEAAIGLDGAFRLTANMTTIPPFELPEYKGVKVRVPRVVVTDEEIDRTVEGYRERFAEFEDVTDRPAAIGDVAVIDYRGTIDGKPIGEVMPKASAYFAQNNSFWFKLEEGSFLPGFAEHLVGARPGEERSVTVTLPEGFPIAEFVGKQVDYAVTVKEVKEPHLPDLDDDLAEKIRPGSTLESLRKQIREEVESQRGARIEEMKVDMILQRLDRTAAIEIPPDLAKAETQARVDDLVKRGQKAGMDEDEIMNRQQEIFDTASRQAEISIRSGILLDAIADKEKISAGEHEVAAQIAMMAERAGVPPRKMVRDLKNEGRIEGIAHGITRRKTLSFLLDNADIEEVDPGVLAAEAAAAAGPTPPAA